MADVTITAPAPGSDLDGVIVVFDWRFDDVAPESSWLYAGSSRGGTQYAARWTGVSTETSIGGLPTDGSTVHVRLWYRVDRSWRFIDETYTAAAEPSLPFMTSPAVGGVLSGSAHTFRWNLNGLEPEATWLYVGTDIGRSDYGARFADTATEINVSQLPTDGSPVHTRLYVKLAGTWHFIDETFTAATQEPPTRDELTRELQALVGTTPDGDVGPQTRAALNRNWVGRIERFDPSFAERLTNDGDVVRWVQRRITAQGGPPLDETGLVDTDTDTAVRAHLARGGVVAAESFLRLLEPMIEPGPDQG